MRRIDELHLEFPIAGSRLLPIAVPARPKPEPGHKVYPYLLRGAAITRPNQVWAMDITYIPMARGFVYLTVVLDWFRSITIEAAFYVETLEEALEHGKPEIFNTDHGSQSRAPRSPAC
jgi:putative transposase